MDATGISHIAICVRDLDKSLAFYRDILGMRVAADRPAIVDAAPSLPF